MTDSADVANQIAAAIMTKFNALDGSGNHNDFWIALNGHLFDGDADDQDYPYSVFWFVTIRKEKTFTEEFTEALIQFDFYSTVSGADARNLRFLAYQLFDEKSLTITGSTLLWMRQINEVGGSQPEDIVTPEAKKAWHAIAEYEAKTSLS